MTKTPTDRFDLFRGCVAEFLGTFALVFFGAGSIIVAPEGGLIGVAMAHGLALVVFVSACMYISGGQFNPAVSVALFAIGKQGAAPAGAFIGSQLLAAGCAAGLLVLALGRAVVDEHRLGATIGSLTDAGEVGPVFLIEVIATFALMFVILAAVVDSRAHRLGGVCVGLVVSMCILGIGPLTGASMNPARTFGPALYGYWNMHWVYWAAPIVGACMAAFVYRFVWEERETPRAVPPLHEGDAVHK